MEFFELKRSKWYNIRGNYLLKPPEVTEVTKGSIENLH